MPATNKTNGVMPSKTRIVGCETALACNYSSSKQKRNSSKEFVKPVGFSIILHVVFALFFTIAEQQENLEIGTDYSSTKQILFINESQIIQPLLVDAKASKPPAIDPTKGSLELGFIGDHDPANVSIVEILPAYELKTPTKTVASSNTLDTEPREAALPLGISAPEGKNSEKTGGFHRSGAPQKSKHATNDETVTEKGSITKLIQATEIQKSTEYNKPKILPESPPKRPVSVTKKSDSIPTQHEPPSSPIAKVSQSLISENIPNSQKTRNGILLNKPPEPSSDATNKSKMITVSGKNRDQTKSTKLDLDTLIKPKNLTSASRKNMTQKKQIGADNNWAKIKEVLELDFGRKTHILPTANATYPATKQRNIASPSIRSKMPNAASDISSNRSNIYNQKACEVSETKDQAFYLEAITTVIQSKTININQLLGQKMYGGQIARNQNISDLLLQKVETRTRPKQLANLSISQLIALKKIAEQQQLFRCQ